VRSGRSLFWVKQKVKEKYVLVRALLGIRNDEKKGDLFGPPFFIYKTTIL
jgi:hypothetical protein